MLNSIGRAEVDMATEVGRFNVGKWQSAFNDAVERLNDAVGENGSTGSRAGWKLLMKPGRMVGRPFRCS